MRCHSDLDNADKQSSCDPAVQFLDEVLGGIQPQFGNLAGQYIYVDLRRVMIKGLKDHANRMFRETDIESIVIAASGIRAWLRHVEGTMYLAQIHIVLNGSFPIAGEGEDLVGFVRGREF